MEELYKKFRKPLPKFGTIKRKEVWRGQMGFKDINQIQNEKVIGRYIKHLELVSLQFGVRPNDLDSVLKQILEECRTATVLNRFTVYQITIETIKLYSPSNSEVTLFKDGKKLFLYEDDENFHQSVNGLDFNIKIPYILSVFHDFTIIEIAALLYQPEEVISRSIEEAEQQIRSALRIHPGQYEKSLDFMKKTYSRLPELTDRQNLFSDNNISEDKIPQRKEEEKNEPSPLLLHMIGAASAVVLFIALFFISSTNIGRVDEQYLVNLEAEFNHLLEDRRQQLGLSQAVFGQLGFVLNARSLNSVFQSEMKSSIDSENPM